MASEQSPLSTERLDAFFEVMPGFARMFRDRINHWLASADHLTGRVASGNAIYEEQALFVVRLAGMVIDLRKRFRTPTPSDQLVEGGAIAEMRERHRDKVDSSIAALYAQLSEDELLWLELRRHEQSHPFLEGYRPKATHGDNWDKWESKILDKRVLPLEEVFDRCAKLEAAQGEFAGVAVSIARKVFQHVGAVQLAMAPLMAGLRF